MIIFGIITRSSLGSQVLSEDENNVKAMFRRGKAKAELGQTDAAREDFLKARKYAPEQGRIQYGGSCPHNNHEMKY